MRVALVQLCVFTSVLTKVPLRLGVLSPITNEYEGYVFEQATWMAVKQFQSNNIEVNYIVENAKCEDITWVTGKTSELIYIHNVTAIIGPGCAQGCITTLNGAEYANRMMISYGCSQFDSVNNTNFARVLPFVRGSTQTIAHYYAELADRFNWKKLGIVFSTNKAWKQVNIEVKEVLEKKGYQVADVAVEAYDGFKELLEDAETQMRIILLLVSEVDTVKFMLKAYERNWLSSSEYAIITVDMDMLSIEHELHRLTKDQHADTLFTGTFNIRASMVQDRGTEKYKEFKNHMQELFNVKFKTLTPFKDEAGFLDLIIIKASYVYDAILVYLRTIENLIEQEYKAHKNAHIDELKAQWLAELKENETKCNDTNMVSVDGFNCTTNNTNTSTPVFNLTLVNYTIINSSFYPDTLANDISLISAYLSEYVIDGLTGEINISKAGMRQEDALLVNIVNDRQNVIHRYSNAMSIKDALNNARLGMKWLGNVPPKDTPECGFSAELCENDETAKTVLMTLGFTVIAVIALFVLWKMYKLQLYENDISSKTSFIRMEDIKTVILLRANATTAEVLDNKGELNKANGITKLKAIYKKKNVMLKRLPKDRVIMSREVMIELKLMRDLDHPNLARIEGVTIRSPYICIVQPFCKKGSLYDVLLNEDIQLDWVFKLTFLWEIVSGMNALHESPIKLHGHLTSKNCLINHRWVVQISDFGLTKYSEVNRVIKQESIENEQEKYEALLWTAPENINMPRKTSKSGDVYGFGIIISEVINRKAPYSEFDDMRPSDIIHYVKKRCIPPFRPHVTLQTGLDPKLLDIMHLCVSENVEERPSFREIKPVMKTIRGESVDILDNMIDMMEKYSSDLDKTAKERSEMFRKEKIKSNELLYRCVPKPIVSQLLEGSTVEPVQIPSASMLAIRIKNFNQLFDVMSAQKMVNILNDYYKMVDRVLITDACQSIFKLLAVREEIVLFTNIPGYKYVSEAEDLARIAVKISIHLYTYKWRHIKNDTLQLQMVLHSGPATGVVVGNKIPVYNVFGRMVDFGRQLCRQTPVNTIVATEDLACLIRYDDNYGLNYVGDKDYEGVGQVTTSHLEEFRPIGIAFPNRQDTPEPEPTPRVEGEEPLEKEEKIEEPIAEEEKKAELPNPPLEPVDTAFDKWFEE